MLSLLGLPLTAGFMGKVLVFRPALEAGNTLLVDRSSWSRSINTAISAYYYLRLIVVMFFRERTTEWLEPKMPLGFAATFLSRSSAFFISAYSATASSRNSLSKHGSSAF